jgi:hypothetical protein
VIITHFDDRTLQADETLGDWIAEKLIREIDRRSQKILFVDYPMVKEFLASRGIPLADLERPNVLRLLNEVFGIHNCAWSIDPTRMPTPGSGTWPGIVKSLFFFSSN